MKNFQLLDLITDSQCYELGLNFVTKESNAQTKDFQSFN
jgi:hypothetical protein